MVITQTDGWKQGKVEEAKQKTDWNEGWKQWMDSTLEQNQPGSTGEERLGRTGALGGWGVKVRWSELEGEEGWWRRWFGLDLYMTALSAADKTWKSRMWLQETALFTYGNFAAFPPVHMSLCSILSVPICKTNMQTSGHQTWQQKGLYHICVCKFLNDGWHIARFK